MGSFDIKCLSFANLKIKKDEKEAGRDMCKAIMDMKEESRAEGRAEGRAEDIITLLEDTGEISEELRSRIMSQIDFDTLKVWLKKAAKATSIAEFTSAIDTDITPA